MARVWPMDCRMSIVSNKIKKRAALQDFEALGLTAFLSEGGFAKFFASGIPVSS